MTSKKATTDELDARTTAMATRGGRTWKKTVGETAISTLKGLIRGNNNEGRGQSLLYHLYGRGNSPDEIGQANCTTVEKKEKDC
jgi:hypothetical protein